MEDIMGKCRCDIENSCEGRSYNLCGTIPICDSHKIRSNKIEIEEKKRRPNTKKSYKRTNGYQGREEEYHSKDDMKFD
jgi:hypothetical protein